MAGVGILWYFALILVNLDNEHAAIKLFLLLISMWYTVALVNLGLQFAIDGSASDTIVNSISVLYEIVVWIARIVSTYYILYYLYYVFNMVRGEFSKGRFGK